MKFTIEITKEVIDESLMCGTGGWGVDNHMDEECAFTTAYRELIPNVAVGYREIKFKDKKNSLINTTEVTSEQRKFIFRFDVLGEDDPNERYQLVGQKFEVEIPDEVIEYWHGDVVEVAQKLVNSDILKPV